MITTRNSLQAKMKREESFEPLLIVPPSGTTTTHAFRLHPKAPLKRSLLECADTIFARSPSTTASLFVITVVGSLQSVKLRLANASNTKEGNKNGGELIKNSMGGSNDIREWMNERFEIVSLVGTFSRDGSCHLHLSMSDGNGNTFGGHLMEGEIFTTAEVVLGSADGIDFAREYDPATGYKEIVPKQIVLQDSNRKNEFYRISLAIFLGFVMGSTYVERKNRN